MHLGEDILGKGFGDPNMATSEMVCLESNLREPTNWNTSAEPPAFSTPFFTASAIVLMCPYMEYWHDKC
jgi:hypothetical protein